MLISYFFNIKIMELFNKQGNSNIFLLRRFNIADIAEIIRCIKDEYGSTYFKRNFYNEDWLSKNAVGNRYLFFCC